LRYYKITVSDPATGEIFVPDYRTHTTTGFVRTPAGSGAATFTTVLNGVTIPGALNIEFDIPVYQFAEPAGAASIRVWGIGLEQISQASNLNGMSIEIAGGMVSGLPLANPAQAGTLARGKIFQAFGNWQGINQTLDFVFYADTGSADAPQNLVLNWKAGMQLSAAISNTLQTAFPTYKQSINIKNLMLVNDEVGYFQTLAQFSRYIRDISQRAGGAGYDGVCISLQGKSIAVYDGSTKPTPPKQIVFTDLIGQPVWKDFATIGLYCVLRSDIQVGDYISLPKAQVTTTAQSYPAYRNQSVFQGTFQVGRVRHVGNFRQPDASSWITVIDAYSSVPNAPPA